MPPEVTVAAIVDAHDVATESRGAAIRSRSRAAEHPHKNAVERTLSELAGLPGGPWQVELRVGNALGWWFIQVYAETSRFRRTLAIGPQQQTAEFIREAWYRAWLAAEVAVRAGVPAE